MFLPLGISLEKNSPTSFDKNEIVNFSVEFEIIQSLFAQSSDPDDCDEECEPSGGSGTTCEVSTSCGEDPMDYVKCGSESGDCQRWGGVSVTCDGNIYWC